MARYQSKYSSEVAMSASLTVKSVHAQQVILYLSDDARQLENMLEIVYGEA